MRTTLFSVLVLLAQWGTPANAQRRPVAPATAAPAATNANVSHPFAQRLFFFTSDPKSFGRQPAARVPAAPARGSFLLPAGYSTLKFRTTGMAPLQSPPPQDFWRFLKPKNTRLFFFNKH